MRLRITAAVAAGLIVIALVGVYLAAHRGGPVGSVPAGQQPPQAMPSGTQDLKAGTYVWTYPLLDAPGKPFPKVVITVPDGWSINGGFGLSSHTNTPRELFVTIWDVLDVYSNGCHWQGAMIRPGPTANELAAVLAARPLRNATTPVAVSLYGYSGKYLEWSVPVDIRFDAATQNFPDCDVGSENGVTAGYFKSWMDTTGGDRYQQAPGQVDGLWIVEVEGHRLLIDATYLPGATAQDRVELGTIVSSIEFRH